jgi:hypothetical protein
MSDRRDHHQASPLLRLAASRSSAEQAFERLIYAVDGHWFFLTADGVDVGPYPSRDSARADADRLSRLLASVDEPAERLALIFEVKFGGLAWGRTDEASDVAALGVSGQHR